MRRKAQRCPVLGDFSVTHRGEQRGKLEAGHSRLGELSQEV